ncbi:ABC transporter ATP-binding protein [Pseudonocardia sulfidoxydans]|uniref:ABC transporter ATP-binding protein n=1 Tax=Pseudonocardia sulfidoxydans TaxID=54011 RepID=UPI001C99A51D|nr:ABC transporter ATP-binding protein [Pseudonocardia sulfidoxydans]
MAVTGARVLRTAVREARRGLSGAGVLLVGHQAGEAMVPVLVGVVIDRAVDGGGVESLLFWLAVLAVDFAVLSLSYRYGARAAAIASVRTDQRLRLRIADRVLDPRGGAEAGRLPGVLAGIAVADAQRVGALGFALPVALSAVAALVVAAVALLNISVPLGLLILLGTPPLLFVVHLLGKPLERRSGPEQERAARAAGVAADLVTGVRVLKGIGAERAAVARYRLTSRDALGATLRATGAQAWYSGTVLALNGLFLALVALVGGRLAADGALSVGQLVSAVGLAQFLIGPLEVFGWVNGRLAQARASAARIAEVLSAPPAVDGEGEVTPAGGAVTVRGLRHGALRDGLDLDVAAGAFVGVVATADEAVVLLDCLGREIDPEEGTVEVDGVGLEACAPAAARRAVLVAGHDALLFTGSVHDNVLAAAPVGTDPAPAMRAAQADEVVAGLPAGASTEVGDRGTALSGGQRQRVALARAVAADPAVLVLHDPTTAVDAVTEARIADGLRAARRGRTTVVVTASPALLAVADRVVLVEAGRVRADGTHADLLRDDARYRKLVLG